MLCNSNKAEVLSISIVIFNTDSYVISQKNSKNLHGVDVLPPQRHWGGKTSTPQGGVTSAFRWIIRLHFICPLQSVYGYIETSMTKFLQVNLKSEQADFEVIDLKNVNRLSIHMCARCHLAHEGYI